MILLHPSAWRDTTAFHVALYWRQRGFRMRFSNGRWMLVAMR